MAFGLVHLKLNSLKHTHWFQTVCEVTTAVNEQRRKLTDVWGGRSILAELQDMYRNRCCIDMMSHATPDNAFALMVFQHLLFRSINNVAESEQCQ